MVTIDNAVIVGLTANEAIAKEFPFLLNARNSFLSGAKPCCGGKAQSTNFNMIKQAIANMPGEAQVKFKQLTGWQTIRVIYETGAGTQTVVF
jgi:hypothetical protein